MEYIRSHRSMVLYLACAAAVSGLDADDLVLYIWV